MNFKAFKNKDDSDSESESNSDKLVKYLDNDIYFYDEVSRASVLKLVTTIKTVTKEVLKNTLDTGGNGKIYLHICSYGGSVFDGLGAMDVIKSNPVPITTIIEGVACSAATFIALGGKEVTMRPSAHVLIHQIHSWFSGKYDEFKAEKETLDKMMEVLRELYTSRTKIPKKVLQSMFKKDIYIDCRQCIEWGVVNSIFD